MSNFKMVVIFHWGNVKKKSIFFSSNDSSRNDIVINIKNLKSASTLYFACALYLNHDPHTFLWFDFFGSILLFVRRDHGAFIKGPNFEPRGHLKSAMVLLSSPIAQTLIIVTYLKINMVITRVRKFVHWETHTQALLWWY